MIAAPCKGKVYVIVVHIPTGRAFTLKRNYGLIDALVTDYKAVIVAAGQRLYTSWPGWTPSGNWQRPDWIRDIPADEFTAYWLTE